jgi:hypothetical protein
MKTPQPADLISLALYRLIAEKFAGIRIAQSLEMPRDLWGFDFLAELDDRFVLITFIYNAVNDFSTADIDAVRNARDVTARGCGWDLGDRGVKIFIFFVAHTVARLQLSPPLLAYLAQFPEISHFRAVCDFRYGVSLVEIDADGHSIDLYPRS